MVGAGRRSFLLAASLCLSFACRTASVPPEVAEAERLERTLWRAGASFFAAADYDRYKAGLGELRKRAAGEKAEFGPFRNFDRILVDARTLVARGNAVLEVIRAKKEYRIQNLGEEEAALKGRMALLQDMTRFFNEDDEVRKALAQAEIKIGQMKLLVAGEKFDQASARLDETTDFVREAETAVSRLMERYRDPDEQKKWKRWADETVAESKRSGVTAFIVSKLERTLTVYRRGEVSDVFEIGLGKYGLTDKLYSGDEATPEGKYRILRKFPQTPFYKAMLVDYPNVEDLRSFVEAKKKGLVPNRADAGGAIEIHGGGKDKLTKGCVGLENRDMDKVYQAAGIGTPVTIVGTLNVDGVFLSAIKAFGKQ
jgi:L,D-peptidoglycan transpeptidase YkuD (ErfK/YbiS/YcfS/YnhG family)